MDRSIPSEFAEFIREVAIRALDRLSARAKEFGPAPRAVIRAWNRLSVRDKEQLIGELIADSQNGDGPETKQPKPPRRKASTKAVSGTAKSKRARS